MAALAATGLDPCDAHLTQIAARGAPLETVAPYRGWGDGDWEAAAERLRTRGWLDADGALTPAGAAERKRIEDTTDALAAEPWRNRAGLGRLVELLAPLTARVLEAGGFPYPNPIGVPPPGTA